MLVNPIIIDEEYVISMRRYFHQYPELSGKEYGTRDKIISELKSMGIAYTKVSQTGVIGIINENCNDLVIGLRADMDALPIEEKSECVYASQNNGVMHACGHDSHMAMLLGAAKALKSIENKLKCKIKLIFQPAEETMLGAKAICEENVIDDVEYIFGMHVGQQIDSGQIGLADGPVMAAVDSFKISIQGKSAHGAMPDQGIDAILVGAQIVSNIQSIVSREIPPTETVVITIGTIKGGTAKNIIAGNVELEGTVRYFNKDLLPIIKSKIEEKSKFIAKSYGAEAKIDYSVCLPPVDNNPDITSIAIDSAKKIGLEPITFKPLTISEDYSILAEGRKSLFGFIGIRGKDTNPILHSNDFDLDESILKYGAHMHVQFVLDLLGILKNKLD